MGTRSREIVGLDVDELIKLLNKAFADEWLAYYQYWIGAQVVKGPMREATVTELLQHATEELTHAQWLCDRITQLGGDPLLSPEDLLRETHCGYFTPSDPYVEEILKQNITGEQCAISAYKNIMDFTKDKDEVTYNLALKILEQEEEHEEDLQVILQDIEIMMERLKR